MPHARKRMILPALKKYLKFFPVVAIQGARQVGKSFLAREILSEHLPKAKYVTFDQLTLRQEAEERTHSFLENYSDAFPLIIDEAQKVPLIFEAIKFEIDKERRPGRFLLLGSIEFSKLTKIRESLTGRLGRIRLLPLTIRECLGLEKKDTIQRKNVMQYLRDGGMPAIFSVRDDDARTLLLQDWIDLTCRRDITQFKGLKLDPDLTFRILALTAQIDFPTRSEIAKKLKVDGRKIETHLKALTELFVLNSLPPHPLGTGRTIYIPMDCGIAHFLGASIERRLHIFLLNERMAKNLYQSEKRKRFFYYRSTGKKIIHLIEETTAGELLAIQVFEQERVKKTDAELMKAFLNKSKKATGFVAAPIPENLKIKSVKFVPWESLT